MGYASYRVWVALDEPDVWAPAALPAPLRMFGLQLILNWIWTPIFFGYKHLTLVGVLLLWSCRKGKPAA